MLIDISKLPITHFELRDLHMPYEIMGAMKSLGFESYVYEFRFLDTIMKYGVQYDVISNSFGERIYRQAFQIPGWPTKPSPRSAGNDMLDIIKHFPGIDKKDVSIKVWDMTHYPRTCSTDPKFEVDKLERQFIKLYTERYGRKPVGNIKSEEYRDTKTVVTDVHFNSLFDYE